MIRPHCWMLALNLALAFESHAVTMDFGPRAVRIEVPSTLDGTGQHCAFLSADSAEPRPLLVLLHTWSSTYDNWDSSAWRDEARKRDWHVLWPDYRGPNNRPQACASTPARQDILDAVAYVRSQCRVDDRRIYLAGMSGGGHMALVMAAHAPALWAAVTAWCPISDLAAWHAESRARKSKYADDIEAVTGGPPGASPEIDVQYRCRSPIHTLAKARHLPLDINAGIHDGHTGSVPIHHTLDAFNVLAAALGAQLVPCKTIQELSNEIPPAESPPTDDTYERRIHFRRAAGPSRVTIFEGSHENLPDAACAWLETHVRQAGGAWYYSSVSVTLSSAF